MPNPRATGLGEMRQMTTPTTESAAAPIMAGRSPTRDTSQPLGILPSNSPTVSTAATRPAMASVAPRSPATVGMIGMIAPSPIEKRSVGSSAGSAIDRQRNGTWVADIASMLLACRGRPVTSR